MGAALSLRTVRRGWTYVLFIGLLFAVFGCLLLFSPFDRASNITLLIGSFGVIMGTLYVIDAFRYRNATSTLDMML